MTTQLLEEVSEFSVIPGGPMYRIWKNTGLVTHELLRLRRRVVVLTALSWAPLLVLSLLEGNVWGHRVALPFARDFELHARLLLALPLLLAAELVVHARMQTLMKQFRERGIVPEAARASFDSAIASAVRLRDSIGPEVIIVLTVYVVGIGVLWRTQTGLQVASWHGAPADGKWRMTAAGWWLICVSLPLFQFLLLRWYFRLFIWARLLWNIARLKLTIMPTHPDRCGGLGFLSSVSHMFAPLLLAQGVALAGLIGSRIFYAGAKLPEFKAELVGLVGLLVLAVLGPLLVFSPKLGAAKRSGMREYGALAQRYVLEYDHKWIRGGAPASEALLGSADIQSLADLGNSFEVLSDMKLAPFSTRTVAQLAVITLLPVLPLTLTMIPLEQLVERLLKIIF